MPRYVATAPQESGWKWLHQEGSQHQGSHIQIYTGKRATGREGWCISQGWFLGSCAAGGLKNFGTVYALPTWKDRADFVSGLYREMYECANILYLLSENQLSNDLHRALLTIGARQIDEFPNLYHGTSMMHLFRVNIRNAAGRFCNRKGEAYKDEKLVNPADIIAEQTERQPIEFQYFNPEKL